MLENQTINKESSIGESFERVNLYKSEEFFQLLYSICPYGKAAILHSERTFLSNGICLFSELVKNQYKPINVILSSEKKTSCENISGLFCLAEDVRALIVVEGALNNEALYFCSLRQIPAVFFCSGNIISSLNKFVLVRCGQRLDFLNADCDRQIIILPTLDYKLVLFNITELLLEFCDLIIEQSLSNCVDRRFFDEHMIEFKNLINLVSEKIDFSLFSKFTGLALEIGKRAKKNTSFTSVLSFSSVDGIDEEQSFLCANYVLNHFSEDFLELNKIKINDYNQTAELLSARLGLLEMQILSAIKSSNATLKGLKDSLGELKNYLPKIRQLCKRAYAVYKKLGGKKRWDSRSIKSAVHSASFLPYAPYSLIIIREYSI